MANTEKIGNHGSSFYKLNGVQGFGIQNTSSAIGFIGIGARVAGDVFLQAADVMSFKYDQDMYFQAVGTDVIVSYTLEQHSLACSDEANAAGNVHWCNPQTVTAGNIVKPTISVFSAIKVHFNAPGIFYVAAR